MKFIHSADFHLGAPNQPSVYREMAIPKLVEEARSRGISYVLVAGDIFDKPSPDQKIKDYFMAQLIGYSNITFILTVGNHDYSDKTRTYHSLNLYDLVGSRVENIRVLSTGVTQIDDVNFIVLPDSIKDYASVSKPKGNNVLVWHGILPGGDVQTTDFSGSKDFVDEIMKHFGATYFALGDIHQPVEITDKCYYSGSLFQKTYTCKSGLRIVDSKTGESEGLSLDLPKRMVLSVKYDVDKDTEEKLTKGVLARVDPGNLIKLKFRLPFSKWSLIDKNKIEEGLKGQYLEVKIVNDPVPEKTSKRKNIDAFFKAKSLNEEIQTILDTDGYQNKGMLLSKCLEFFNRKGE
jgi:DNA repair exonuclease SbcCD nuclease subunit